MNIIPILTGQGYPIDGTMHLCKKYGDCDFYNVKSVDFPVRFFYLSVFSCVCKECEHKNGVLND